MNESSRESSEFQVRMTEDFKRVFFETLKLLREYLPYIIVGGGWAPPIYYHYVLKNKSIKPIRTKDIDLMVRRGLPVMKSGSVEKILREAGFKELIGGHGHSAAVKYISSIEGQDVEIEFITDRRGAREEKVVTVQKGLRAQALRFVSIALENVLGVEIDDWTVEGEKRPLLINVPSPAAFLFQKGLVFPRRSRRLKKEKDLYSIFEILVHCEEIRDQILSDFSRLRSEYPWYAEFENNLHSHFESADAKGVVMVRNQRPPGAFPGLMENQFRQYVHGIVRRFLVDLRETQ